MSIEPPFAMDLPEIPDHEFTRIEGAGFVTILVSGSPVLGFDRKNQAQRDVVIASMVLGGCPGETVAKRCGVKPSWVTREE